MHKWDTYAPRVGSASRSVVPPRARRSLRGIVVDAEGQLAELARALDLAIEQLWPNETELPADLRPATELYCELARVQRLARRVHEELVR
jgi:hypothetical protein